jgi:Fic-DOC domain mobile mystery protein B
MEDLLIGKDGSTSLEQEELECLKQPWVRTRNDLNIVEQDNINSGSDWAYKQIKKDILNVPFARKLHTQMLGNVWKWAGEYRTTIKNLGIDPHLISISTELSSLMDETQYWIDHQTYGLDEIAIRFHHRLVFIHPFPNGNGRHARLFADILIKQLGGEVFSWGGQSIEDPGTTRDKYISALRKADNHDIGPLLVFSRT